MKYVGDTIVFPEARPDGSGYQIPIRAYHRAAVGIFPGTKVFLLPIPSTLDLIVTPIEPRKWGDLWKIEVLLKDTPGAARSIVETLAKNRVNILIQEGLSDYAHKGALAHRVLLVVDLADYYSDIDGNTSHRNTVDKPSLAPNQLITRSLANAVDYLHATPAEDRWDFSFGRMEFFYRNKEHRKRSEQTHLVDKGILVPESVIHQNIYGSNGIPSPERIACHIISDTEEKYVKVRFLKPSVSSILIRIEHEERSGAIYSFMNVLVKKRANISNSYSRVVGMSQEAVWYAFCEVPGTFSQNDLWEMLNDLSELDDVKSFTVSSHYGFTFSVEDFTARLHIKKFQAPKPPTAPKTSPAVLPRKHREIEELLKIKPFYAGRDWQPQPNNVFVAMPFDEQYDEFYRNHIEQVIESCGLHAVRIDKAKIPDPNIPIMELVRSNIATCRFVVADVTGFKANVLYEVGLAHAVGKRVLFMCEDKYRNERGLLFDISPFLHLFYSPYKINTFGDELKKRIQDMKDHPP